MPGKCVRFHGIPSTPQSDYSPSILPPSGSPILPYLESRLNPKLSIRERLIQYDLTLPPENALVHRGLLRGFLNDQATYPPLPSMTIVCEALPHRSISVVASQRGDGVTIMDVLCAIYTYLRASVSEADFKQLSTDAQHSASAAFQRRYRGIMDEKVYAIEKSKGLKLVDMLGQKKMFLGLRLRGPDVWELCLS